MDVGIISQKFKKGEIAVIPTDTIYGLSTNALIENSIEKIYKIKGRTSKKPLIILISDIFDLELFNIKIDKSTKKILEKVWPGKVSVIFPCLDKKFFYLHRGKKTLAFRLPEKESLLQILRLSGPLASTSANPEGKLPAKTIKEAKKYFGNSVDFYVDEGPQKSLPSTLIKIKNGKIEILRQGEEKI